MVYLSAEPETAMREANENLRYYGVALWKGMPKVTVAVRVETETTLDLTDPNVAAHLPEPMANLLAEDWRAVMARGNESTTQAMGRAAFDAGLQGLRVPSKADPNGVNLLVFPARLTRGSRLQVVNPTDLEKLGKPT